MGAGARKFPFLIQPETVSNTGLFDITLFWVDRYLIKDIRNIHEMIILKELCPIYCLIIWEFFTEVQNIRSRLNYHFNNFIYNQLKLGGGNGGPLLNVPLHYHINHPMCQAYKQWRDLPPAHDTLVSEPVFTHRPTTDDPTEILREFYCCFLPWDL